MEDDRNSSLKRDKKRVYGSVKKRKRDKKKNNQTEEGGKESCEGEGLN